jgi:4-coumarate--CoA ligase
VGRTVRTAVPTHHIYGFIFGVLLPAARDGVQAVDYCGRLPSALLREVRSGDVVVAHPLVWRALAETPGRWPAGVTGVTSTAPCPPDTIRRLKEAGLARIVEVYGSSETSGIGWRDDSEAPFQLLPRWTLDSDGTALVDAEGRRYALPDHVEREGSGLRPVGRVDEAVQVAGHNVYAARVADVLRSHPDVAEATVRLDASGGRLKAFVVPRDGGDCDAEALRAWCRRELVDAAIPGRFDFGSRLPRNVMGKPADWD